MTEEPALIPVHSAFLEPGVCRKICRRPRQNKQSTSCLRRKKSSASPPAKPPLNPVASNAFFRCSKCRKSSACAKDFYRRSRAKKKVFRLFKTCNACSRKRGSRHGRCNALAMVPLKPLKSSFKSSASDRSHQSTCITWPPRRQCTYCNMPVQKTSLQSPGVSVCWRCLQLQDDDYTPEEFLELSGLEIACP